MNKQEYETIKYLLNSRTNALLKLSKNHIQLGDRYKHSLICNEIKGLYYAGEIINRIFKNYKEIRE